MTLSLFWLQCGACGGDSMSLLNAREPNVLNAFDMLGVEVLWHPSLSNGSPADCASLVERLVAGEQALDVLCVEGGVIRGPRGTGMYDTWQGRPRKDLVSALARRAGVVVAVGTCASHGGVCACTEVEATGLQFHRDHPGGFLGADFRSGAGLPVINLPGCPAHCDVILGTLAAVRAGAPLPLNRFQAPREWYGTLVHQGCTRNEYHEYRIEERDFGQRGCLFFYLGCRGPMTYGPCNKLLWNHRNSKTRAGVPCMGCTRPDFPLSFPFFRTRSIEDVPLDLPDGVDRPHYLASKTMSAAAAPARLKSRETPV